eukprot:999327-Rhodomonas_salina.1
MLMTAMQSVYIVSGASVSESCSADVMAASSALSGACAGVGGAACVVLGGESDDACSCKLCFVKVDLTPVRPDVCARPVSVWAGGCVVK